MGILWDRIKGFFFPTFSELSLFMMGVAFVLVFFSNESLIHRLYAFHVSHLELGSVLIATLGVVFILGLALCLYFVLIEWEKSRLEKYAMLCFAILSNAFCGIYVSMYIMDKSAGASGIFFVLPIWNIINCVLLFGSFSEKNISDEKATIPEVLFGLIVIVGIFLICHFVFKLYWALTFSICVIVATGFSDASDVIFHPQRLQVIEEDDAIERYLQEGYKMERCVFCKRLIRPTETSCMIERKYIVCKECHDKIQGIS
jgi:hypothetical protein